MGHAVLSDIHANLPALEAVLGDMHARPLDGVYCLGDLVGYAPFPNEVTERIRAERIPTAYHSDEQFIYPRGALSGRTPSP